jgi:hypothetical protein
MLYNGVTNQKSYFSHLEYTEVSHGTRERYTQERNEAHGDRRGVLVTEDVEAVPAGEGA